MAADELVPDRRSTAREAAMILLYQADNSGLGVEEVIAAQTATIDEAALILVRGVAEHRERIDEAISAHAKGWALNRMPTIDRAVLRLAAFELLGRPGVPVAVVLDEAVELAKTYSTDNSARFVNGVLAALVPVLRGG